MWKGTSIKATWWLWKVTYAWIGEYFRMLCKSIDYIQSNEEIWGEDGRDTYGREDHMLTIKKLYYMVVATEESQNINVLSNHSLMKKLQAHEKRVNEI
jgi:hypothetical protein